MPYNPYFPATYNPYSYQQQGYPQNIQPAQQQIPGYQQPQAQQMPQQLQTQVVIRVPSYDAVKAFSLDDGKPLTFMDENSPFCYVKTPGTSPVDPPKVRIFEMIERDEAYLSKGTKNSDISEEQQRGIDLSGYATVDDIRKIRAVIDDIQADVDKLHFDIDAVTEKSSKKMVQRARKDADEE